MDSRRTALLSRRLPSTLAREIPVRLSLALLAVSLLGVLAGGWLTGRLGLGLCVIADSVAVAAWALLHDDGQRRTEPQAYETPTLHEVLERARRSG